MGSVNGLSVLGFVYETKYVFCVLPKSTVCLCLAWVMRIVTNAINYFGVLQENQAEFLAGERNHGWELSELHIILTINASIINALFTRLSTRHVIENVWWHETLVTFLCNYPIFFWQWWKRQIIGCLMQKLKWPPNAVHKEKQHPG